MKVIVHIGVHKTGTSAIQAFLARNAENLSERGVFYSPTPLDAWQNHHPLAVAFRKSSPPDVGRDAMASLLSAADGRTVLISSEMLCEGDTDVDRFLETLKSHEVEVIAYIRHPCDIVISAFNELVRHHGTKWTRPINEQPFAYAPSQTGPLKRWLVAEKVTLAPYDRAQWVRGSIFSDFLDMIDVSGEGLDFTQTNGNESLPHPLAETLRLVNMTELSENLHRAILAHLRTVECGSPVYPLTPETVELLLGMMREAIPQHRPFFRSGFREAFLFEPRPVVEPVPRGRSMVRRIYERLRGMPPR